jgi:carbonic anhydrase
MTSDCTCSHDHAAPAPLADEHPVSRLLVQNRAWAERKTAVDPGFFKRLAAQQTPAYLWIGCSDSRVPATEIVDLDPGEMFVHRNIANLAPAYDANYLSVLQYAVTVLKVRHILVVGHYGCGGVLAALQRPPEGPVSTWLGPLQALAQAHKAELDALPDEAARHDRLCEINVRAQVKSVAANPIVTQAWAEGADLTVHGWCYSVRDGVIVDLGATVTPPAR